jgi:hypothetical protein
MRPSAGPKPQATAPDCRRCRPPDGEKRRKTRMHSGPTGWKTDAKTQERGKLFRLGDHFNGQLDFGLGGRSCKALDATRSQATRLDHGPRSQGDAPQRMFLCRTHLPVLFVENIPSTEPFIPAGHYLRYPEIREN